MTNGHLLVLKQNCKYGEDLIAKDGHWTPSSIVDVVLNVQPII